MALLRNTSIREEGICFGLYIFTARMEIEGIALLKAKDRDQDCNGRSHQSTEVLFLMDLENLLIAKTCSPTSHIVKTPSTDPPSRESKQTYQCHWRYLASCAMIS